MAQANFRERASSLTRPSRIATAKTLNTLNLTVRATTERLDCPAPPAQVSSLDYWQCLSLFKQADLDGNATLEEREFARFISMVFPGDSWWMDLPGFFKAVDVDNSGEISLEEFLGWVYTIPSTTIHAGKMSSDATKGKSMVRTNSSPALSSASTTDPSSPTMRRRDSNSTPATPTSPLSPASPQRSQRRLKLAGQQLMGSGGSPEPIVFEINCSHCFAEGSQLDPSQLHILEHQIRDRMKGRVRVKKVVEPVGASLKGVLSVTALLGTGIKFWDKGPMIAFRADPFTSHHLMEKWVKNLATIHVPLLFRILSR